MAACSADTLRLSTAPTFSGSGGVGWTAMLFHPASHTMRAGVDGKPYSNQQLEIRNFDFKFRRA
jgi:hypothetical protein